MSAPPCTDCGGPLGYCVAPCPASPLREDEQHLVDEFLASFTPADRAAIALREALRRYTGMEGVRGVEVEGESILVLANSRKRANALRAFVGDQYWGVPVKFSARRAPKAP